MERSIKLVATDMDGTLLDSRKKLPEEFFEIVTRLPEVKFVIASGRQYYNILKECEPIKDRICIIAENGAILSEGETVFFTDAMDPEIARAVSKKAMMLEDTCFLICGEKKAYIVGDPSQEMPGSSQSYYERIEYNNDIDHILQTDRVLKIALYRHKRAQDYLFPEMDALLSFSEHVKTVLSGQSWVDIMNRDLNKGRALRQIQKRYGILPEESMAFGDYLNDSEMLSVCGESYAMANALPELKKQAKYIAPSNDEQGVVSVLRQTFML